MKLYYRAVTQDGKTIRGLIEAKDINEAAMYLRQHQFVPVQIIPETKTGYTRFIPFLYHVKNSDVVFFYKVACLDDHLRANAIASTKRVK